MRPSMPLTNKQLLIPLLIVSFFAFTLSIQAQDCSSLRGDNETYGAGDKNVSWCDMTSKTAYTQCMCEQEKANKLSAVEKNRLNSQALSASTKASALYTQAHNLAYQAYLDKDRSKLEEAEILYQQVINLSNEAKAFKEQAYADSDEGYNNLKNLHLEQYNKLIEWATTGIESIDGQREKIIAKNNEKQIFLRPSTTNSWDLSTDTNAENSWASNEAQEAEQSNESDGNEMDHWTQEETLNWIQNNIGTNGHKKGDKANHELITSKSSIILKNTWYAEPSNGNPSWVYEKTIIPIDCF